MNIIKKYLILVLLMLITSQACIQAMNTLMPYRVLLQPGHTVSKCFQTYAFIGGGVHSKNYGPKGEVENVLRLWSPDQNTLAMLKGFAPGSTISQLEATINAYDDGTRGHVLLFGNLHVPFWGAVGFRYFFCDNWSAHVYLPITAMQLTDVRIDDLTQDVTAQDQRVKTFLTDNLAEEITALSGLEIGDWHRRGVGDITGLIQWSHNFCQEKPLLKNVCVSWFTGLSLPTGLRQDENKLMALPFGNDGAVTLPFGVGLDLLFARYIQVGAQVLLIHTFGNTRPRRIKTFEGQSDLFLLQKVHAYKEYGLTQCFELYVEGLNLVQGLELKVGYQYFKRGSDQLAFDTNAFSVAIANTAPSLDQWTSHSIVIETSYDFGAVMPCESVVVPHISLFTCLPFNGQRSTLQTIVGCSIAFDF